MKVQDGHSIGSLRRLHYGIERRENICREEMGGWKAMFTSNTQKGSS
jgi:hypothetical protein